LRAKPAVSRGGKLFLEDIVSKASRGDNANNSPTLRKRGDSIAPKGKGKTDFLLLRGKDRGNLSSKRRRTCKGERKKEFVQTGDVRKKTGVPYLRVQKRGKTSISQNRSTSNKKNHPRKVAP